MTLIFCRITFIAPLLLLCCLSSVAQIVKKQGFAIQLGVFKFPDKSRFLDLNDLGEIYTEALPNKLTRIKLGNYEKRVKADSVLNVVKMRNYAKAYVILTEITITEELKTNVITKTQEPKKYEPKLDRPPAARPAAYSIQIGAFGKKTSMNTGDMPNLDKLERPFVVEQDSTTKWLSGMFTNKDSAEVYLTKVKEMGYENAFVVEDDLQNALIAVPGSPQNADLAQTYRPVRNFETASFYKRMEGTLNTVFPVTVHAYFSSASITGFYDDPKNKTRKKFVYYGYRAGNNSLPETQFSTEGGLMVKASASPKTEQMKLAFSVKDIETNENLTFSLKETYPLGSAQFDIISIYKKRSQQGNKGEMGADLYLEYPMMIGTNSRVVEGKINTLASQLSGATDEASMTNKVDNQLKQGLEKIMTYYPQYRWLSQTYETKILENTKNLLSLRMSNELIVIEPQSKIIHKSFNLANGAEIMLNEVLNVGFEKSIFNMLREKIGKQFAKLRPPITEVNASVEEMMKNYYFTSQGIVFFRDYKKNNLLAEPLEITIAYSEIKLMINKNGFLNSFIK
jgi:hypothetical protein